MECVEEETHSIKFIEVSNPIVQKKIEWNSSCKICTAGLFAFIHLFEFYRSYVVLITHCLIISRV